MARLSARRATVENKTNLARASDRIEPFRGNCIVELTAKAEPYGARWEDAPVMIPIAPYALH